MDQIDEVRERVNRIIKRYDALIAKSESLEEELLNKIVADALADTPTFRQWLRKLLGAIPQKTLRR